MLKSIKKAVKFFLLKNKASTDQQIPPTFAGELNRQCSAIALKASLLAIFSWLLFIPLDQALHGDIPTILYLRVGFTLVGVIALLLHFTPFFKEKGYWLILFIIHIPQFVN